MNREFPLKKVLPVCSRCGEVIFARGGGCLMPDGRIMCYECLKKPDKK